MRKYIFFLKSFFYFNMNATFVLYMKKEEQKTPQRIALKRTNRVTFVFNDEEMKMLNRFFSKYKVQNKSRWMRETILTSVLKTFEEDYPKLFQEREMK